MPRLKRPKASTEEERLERNRERARAWKVRNKEAVRAMRAAHYVKNKSKEREQNREWLAANPEKIAIYRERWGKSPKARAAHSAWQKENSERLDEHRRARYRSDHEYRLRMCLRASLTQALRLGKAKKRCSVFHLIGCSTEDLMRHLERQFKRGMSWDNYGSSWVVDHIRPCASFDLREPAEQKACFHFTNLRPLCKIENLEKRDRLTLLA